MFGRNKETLWSQGFPKRIGLYRCKHNEEETYLLHKICSMNGKHRWMTTRGEDVVGNVEWTGEALAPEDITPIHPVEGEAQDEPSESAENVEIMKDESDYIHAEIIDEE